MFCKQCGNSMASDTTFCGQCGTAMEKKENTGVGDAVPNIPQVATDEPQSAPAQPTTPTRTISPGLKKAILFGSIGLVLVAVLVILLVTGVFGGSGRLVGEWESVSMTHFERGERPDTMRMHGEMTLEFFRDGTGISYDGWREEDFRWRTRGRSLEITTRDGGRSETQEFTFRVRGNTLTLTQQEDRDFSVEIEFERVRGDRRDRDRWDDDWNDNDWWEDDWDIDDLLDW